MGSALPSLPAEILGTLGRSYSMLQSTKSGLHTSDLVRLGRVEEVVRTSGARLTGGAATVARVTGGWYRVTGGCGYVNCCCFAGKLIFSRLVAAPADGNSNCPFCWK